MREIKFRAWDNSSNEWVFGGESMDLYHSGEANVFLFDNDAIDIPSNVTWVQFTGLKDKNGKEIYEGDVVEYVSLAEDETVRGQVAYEKSYFTITNPHLPYPNNYHGWTGDDVEVIGNTYENPELAGKDPLPDTPVEGRG